jgi:uncharacterized protein YaiE (UPF0345 family)
MKIIACALLVAALPLFGQDKPGENWKALEFLKGTWEAKTTENGAVKAAGSYSFGAELGDHVLARHSTTSAGCQAPSSYDCEHGDLLYVYQDAPGLPLKAIYFDNEGHVIHYDVTTPKPGTAIFLSEASHPGPQFRLVYERNATVMSGKFQVKMPGQGDWKSYLEWSGAKK